MDRNLLTKLWGSQGRWQGPCTVLLDSNASARSVGPDSIVSGGAKHYAPRIITGRVEADAVCLMPEHSAVLIVQRITHRTHTGEEKTQQILMVVDLAHLVGVEFEDLSMLKSLGVPVPEIPKRASFAPGTLVG
ncbi:MAG TPA: hypothetical protein VKD72_02165 [Gemmataceae bacterium]|nr:hypothetical protein [Gemmataceae bacterium]